MFTTGPSSTPSITILLACQKRPSRSRLVKPLAQKPIRDFVWVGFYAFSFSNTFIQSFQHLFSSLDLLMYYIIDITNHRCDFRISSCYFVHWLRCPLLSHRALSTTLNHVHADALKPIRRSIHGRSLYYQCTA